ncbi:spidroin-1-like [Sorghum bicolor]|uniref:spidroin-1-like n=1 Tax=Sorghum bicolor TaxID=4558 RepID=UPI000B423E7C|nr:spidroin-1-like [Sorghum bicolor]|eukprot:XP_021319213.1 spidroin-1-like [Sorghum bicolor]
MTDQVSPVYKGIRKKDKGFVDVTKGIDIVQVKVHSAKAGLSLERDRREKEGDLGTGGSSAAEKSFAWGGAAAAARSAWWRGCSRSPRRGEHDFTDGAGSLSLASRLLVHVPWLGAEDVAARWGAGREGEGQGASRSPCEGGTVGAADAEVRARLGRGSLDSFQRRSRRRGSEQRHDRGVATRLGLRWRGRHGGDVAVLGLEGEDGAVDDVACSSALRRLGVGVVNAGGAEVVGVPALGEGEADAAWLDGAPGGVVTRRSSRCGGRWRALSGVAVRGQSGVRGKLGAALGSASRRLGSGCRGRGSARPASGLDVGAGASRCLARWTAAAARGQEWSRGRRRPWLL